MTPMVDTSAESERATEVRHALVDRLRDEGMFSSSVVEEAFRTVPRHLFVPEGTPLEVAYDGDNSVAVKRDSDGVIISSTSAPFIQARMIGQAGLGPGMSVLEIGSGGYNAALLAEVVGRHGRVISVDIDPEVTERARAVLEATGYGTRVSVVQADAEERIPGLAGLVDAIVVTVGAWDLGPVWPAQLAPDGVLVVPLRMNGVTRSIGFRREGDHLVSTSAEVCGFVPMQGAGAHDERVFLLPDGHGRHVKLRFDDAAPQDLTLLDGVLATDRAEAWSGVTIKNQVSFADLHLWLACFLPGFCKLAADPGIELAPEGGRWFPFGAVRGDSLTYLTTRPALDGAGAEFGARAHGVHGPGAAAALIEQIQAWDRRARWSAGPSFGYWPTGTDHPQPSQDTAVLAKTHGVVTISWPLVANTAAGQSNPNNTESKE